MAGGEQLVAARGADAAGELHGRVGEPDCLLHDGGGGGPAGGERAGPVVHPGPPPRVCDHPRGRLLRGPALARQQAQRVPPHGWPPGPRQHRPVRQSPP